MKWRKSWLLAVMTTTLLGVGTKGWAQDDPVVIEFEEEETNEAEAEAEQEETTVRLGRVDVIGTAPEALESVPGSASVVESEELVAQKPIDAAEVIRTMPGVHIRDEEGMSLRPNIGIRGLDPARSRNLLILEDGVPTSLAPYGEPESYYAPAIERIDRLELVKGAGSILWGPQTIGGVLNFITAAPPEEFTLTAEARGGSHGYYLGRASVGDTMGRVGYLVSAMHRRYEGHTHPRSLDLVVTDVTGKLRFEITDDAALNLKLQFYDEFSRSSYLGLTTPQFQADPTMNFAIHDELPIRRYSLSASYEHFLSDNVFFETTLYGYNVTRFWDRQDFGRADEGGNYERIIDGEGRSVAADAVGIDDGSAIFFHESMGSRNREFFVAGVEPRASIEYSFGEVDNELIVGARVHGEMALEQRVDSPAADRDNKTIRSDEVRRGLGLAAYALNRFMLFEERLQVSPGLRVENFWNQREITRDRVNGTPTDLDPSRVNEGNTFALIPGIGISFGLTDDVTAFGGVHRGFAPPRTKDAVTNDGDLLELEAEYSVNYELGLRASVQDWLSAEVAGFMLNFSNQIIPPSEYGGAVSEQPGGLVNAGESRHLGVESQVSFDLANLANQDFRLPLSVSYTFVDGRFGDEWEANIAGNRLPYAPEHRLASSLRFSHPIGVAAQLNGTYISEQYSDKGNTEAISVDGLVGKIDPYYLLDANISYTYAPIGVTVFVAGKNLTDETYIASRAPRGIMPGTPRQIFGGVRGAW